MTRPPDYSDYASSYSRSRPVYPAELFTWLASVVERREIAWDAATGNGQAAIGLAAHFDRVIGTDTSEAQIRHAVPHPRVAYSVAQAEAPPLRTDSVDLAVVASALHWFNLPVFYEAVRRVTPAGGVLAVWTYHVAHVGPPFDNVLWPFYRDIVAGYFAPGARLVDDRYAGLELPGKALDPPSFTVSVAWTASEIIEFVRTWSGVQSCKAATGSDPVVGIEPEIKRLCGTPDSRHHVQWPIYLRASRL